jgi:hypothetical protein
LRPPPAVTKYPPSRERPRHPESTLTRNAASMRKLRARRQLEEGNGMGSSDYDKMEPAAAQKQHEWSKKMRVATSDSDGDDPHPPHGRPSIRPASPYARRPNIPSAPSPAVAPAAPLAAQKPPQATSRQWAAPQPPQAPAHQPQGRPAWRCSFLSIRDRSVRP